MVKRKMPHGDVTDSDIKSFRKVEFLYGEFSKARVGFEPRVTAKCLICFAYEYFALGMDEVSDEFMLEASEVCPEYFEKYMLEDMKANSDLETVFGRLAEYYDDRFFKKKEK